MWQGRKPETRRTPKPHSHHLRDNLETSLQFATIQRLKIGIEMSSREKNRHWSVFDAVEAIPVTLPEALMSETNAAITALEYARATALLDPSSSSPSNGKDSASESMEGHQYDVRMAGEAYRAGCAALGSEKLDEALRLLNLSLSKCPPHKASAVNKLQSLISLTSQQLQKPLS